MMRQPLGLVAISIMLFLASCTKSSGPSGTDYISRMLDREIAYMQGHKSAFTVSKTVTYGQTPVTTVDSIGNVIKILKSIQDMAPGRLLINTGFAKDSSVKNIQGQSLRLVTLKRISSKESPFRLVSTQQLCQGGNCDTWKAFHLERNEDNYLYHSLQTYQIGFNKGHINSIQMRTDEHSTLSSDVHFGLVIKLTQK